MKMVRPKEGRAGPDVLLLGGKDFVVDAGSILLVQRARNDVEPGRDAVRGHGGKRQRHVTGGLRILPLGGVHIAVQHFLRRVGGIAPADDRNFTRLHAHLIEDALDRTGDQIAEADDAVDFLAVSREVIGHAVDTLAWSSVVSVIS